MIKFINKQKQYEYLYFDVKYMEDINKYGKQGWICLDSPNKGKTSYMFYREIPKKKIKL